MAWWIPIAIVLAQQPQLQQPQAPGEAQTEAGPEGEQPPEAAQIEQLTLQVQQLQQELQAQRQQVQALQQQLQTQQQSVVGLQSFATGEVQRRVNREEDRRSGVASVARALDAVTVAREAVQSGQQDVSPQLQQANALLGIAATDAARWGMNRQAELLQQSQSMLASVPAYLAERNFWEAKLILLNAEQNARTALAQAQAVSTPQE